MSKIQSAVALAVEMANDPSHGYSQVNRWGPDYDCSSFLIHVWQQAGVPVRSAGASYTGNMKTAFLKCGFADVSALVNLATGSGCAAGDILLNERSHVAMSLGNGQMVWASTSDGHPESGDQTGREIRMGAFYAFPWDCCLRYVGDSAAGEIDSAADAESAETSPRMDPDTAVAIRTLRRGMTGEDVRALQLLLIGRNCSCGPDGADGDFGPNTLAAVRTAQRHYQLAVDGEAGRDTLGALLTRA